MNATIRRKVEADIVRRFVDDALAAGHRLAVSLDRGYDLDEMLLGSRDPEAIMHEAMAGDDCHVFVQPADGPTVERGRVVSVGWVRLVFGNDGYDVIVDYTTNLEGLLAGANALADTYA